MERRRYLHESFRASVSDFDERFSEYLNEKASDQWKVKHCTFSSEGAEKAASCLFKGRKHHHHHQH